MIEQGLQYNQQQKMSPLQIQVVKLIELPSSQLEQRIKEEMEDNPLLESGEEQDIDDYNEEPQSDNTEPNEKDFSIDEYLQNETIPTYKLQTNNYSKVMKSEEIPFSTGTSFREHLIAQLGLRILTEKQKIIAEQILGNIDEDGYLRRNVEEITDDLAFTQGLEVETQEVDEIVTIIQDFDPPGVGAKNLQECLLLQIQRKGLNTPDLNNAFNLLKDNFDLFARKHYDRLKKKLAINDKQLKLAIDEILRLNPKPGSSYSNPLEKNNFHIIPDFILEEDDNHRFNLMLNNLNVPYLRINKTYSDMLTEYQTNKKKRTPAQKEAITFVKLKLDSARWFIDAIKQRQDTLMTVMSAILEYQLEYFAEGDETKLKPMILKDIADITGFDISTVSRVSSSKYIQTHFGILPLKFFFSEKIQTETGEEVSTREIKKILENCINNENKQKPLTDEQLTEILKEKSYNIARRTIAKYRERMGIPVARLRKEL
ncbi:MAG: RNA polymerase factor sigma-54 [Marinilabiliaceae bacterium]|nr:RNA polymerase factor sigma-54 [Marinilabiliaceae bacterium]